MAPIGLPKLAACLAAICFAQLCNSLGSTDTITWGGDNSRAGYETNHNLDPRTIASADFGNIWTAKLTGNFNNIGQEQVLSQPLVYTTGDGIQYVFVATTQNNLYKINAKTGDIVKTRNLGVPFLAADLNNCNDIAPAIGVTGTGVIDPSTGLWYLTSKTYSEQFQGTLFGPSNAPGRANGRYYFHAINTVDLSEAPNFPRPVHGTVFRNNNRRMLIAGDQHQRPALLQVGDIVYTGWASHCIMYNYTGAIIGFHKTTGAIVEAFATQGGPEPNTVPGGGIWMSGGGLAYDGAGSMFFSTGNGYAGQLPANGRPVSGRNPPTALDEAVVNMKLHDDGTVEPVDFFMPWEKTQLDGADKDLGTTPFQLLPSSFSCPNHRRIGMVTGKSGKTYWLNVDNLGGYQLGPNRLDDAIQVFQNENSVYSGAGVMPLGKYIYINVINYGTRVFQFSCNANGNGAFTEVTTAVGTLASGFGVGHGTTTSIDGREGTGLYWTTDVDGVNLRIYDATPPSDGSPMKLLKGMNVPGSGKFMKPVFGDGRAYVAAQGALYAYGSPVNLALNCSSPVAFPRTPINNTSDALTINCTAVVATSILGFNISGSQNFVTEDLPTLPLTLAPGKLFSFRARFFPKRVGSLSSDVIISTRNQAAGSSSTTPVTLTGSANSAAGLFSIQPITVTFNSTVGAGEVTKSVFFNNEGDTALKISSIQFSLVSETGPWVTPNTTANGTVQVAQFVFSGLPTSIAPNERQTVGLTYSPTTAGNHVVFVKASTDGGTKLLNIFGATGSDPIALFEFERADGTGWDQYVPGQNFTFGNVAPGNVRKLVMRITNIGSSTASPLGLTVSKPPFGVPGFVRAVNGIDLAEGTQIAAGQSANATVFCAPPEKQLNTPATFGTAGWRINTNNNQGAVILNFDCRGASPQVGPLLSNGTAQFGYIGCYQDNLAVQAYSSDNNTAETCIKTCAQEGWTFSGTVWRRECWCGNALPLKRGIEEDCNYRCTGDDAHACGGGGVNNDKAMISLFADSKTWDGVTESPPLTMTLASGDYTYQGCFAEKNGIKTFNAKSQDSQRSNTIDNCRNFCGGSQLFGLQYSSECFCGSSIAQTSTITSDSECSMTCKGNSSQYCGGPSRMQVYRLGGSSQTSSTTISSISTSTVPTPTAGSVTIGNYKYQDCYSEVIGGRALTAKQRFNDEDTTNRLCADFCTGYKYFGTEYARECYCGDDLDPTSLPVTDGRCNMPCKGGNGTEICGGPNGLSLFKLQTTTSSSSMTSHSSTTSSSGSTEIAGQTSSSTTNSMVSSSTTATLTSTISATTVSSTTASLTTTALVAPTTGPLTCPDSNGATFVASGKTFLIECGRDYVGNDLKAQDVGANNLNKCIEACASTAGCMSVALSGAACYMKSGLGNAVSNGVWGAKLMASSSVTSSSVAVTSSTTSNSRTTSSTTSSSTTSSSMTSSSSNAMSSTITSKIVVSSTSTSASTTLATSTTTSSTTTKSATITTSSSTPTGPTVVPTAGFYYSLGCYGEIPNGRALSETFSNPSMTIEMCAKEATRRDLDFFGVEYGQECYLGDTLSPEAKPLTQPSCDKLCPGNSQTWCGGSSTLQMYRLNSTLATPKAAAPDGPLKCPDADDTVYTTAKGGKRFRIECGWDRGGGSQGRVTAKTYEECLDACAGYEGCKSVALLGENCYLKTGALGSPEKNEGIKGATLLTKSMGV